jgi:hypothetical protein
MRTLALACLFAFLVPVLGGCDKEIHEVHTRIQPHLALSR